MINRQYCCRSVLAGLALALVSLPLQAPQAAKAADWQDSDCRSEKDDGGNPVKVCRDQESIGIFWEDDSYVNGWCDDREYEIEYSGISKSDALSWVKYYC